MIYRSQESYNITGAAMYVYNTLAPGSSKQSTKKPWPLCSLSAAYPSNERKSSRSTTTGTSSSRPTVPTSFATTTSLWRSRPLATSTTPTAAKCTTTSKPLAAS